jgi:hypothetical protein
MQLGAGVCICGNRFGDYSQKPGEGLGAFQCWYSIASGAKSIWEADDLRFGGCCKTAEVF